MHVRFCSKQCKCIMCIIYKVIIHLPQTCDHDLDLHWYISCRKIVLKTVYVHHVHYKVIIHLPQTCDYDLDYYTGISVVECACKIVLKTVHVHHDLVLQLWMNERATAYLESQTSSPCVSLSMSDNTVTSDSFSSALKIGSGSSHRTVLLLLLLWCTGPS